jgi:transcriptional regulator with XRE-family HTH domain
MGSVRTRGPYETSPVPDQPRSLPERLRWLRKNRGLTQVEVSEALGCEQAMISSWEVGRTRPSAIALGALARFYDLSLLALDAGEGFMDQAARALAKARESESGKAGATSEISITLQPGSPGRLVVMDTAKGSEDHIDPAEGMAKLLQALKKGRQAWIVLR